MFIIMFSNSGWPQLKTVIQLGPVLLNALDSQQTNAGF